MLYLWLECKVFCTTHFRKSVINCCTLNQPLLLSFISEVICSRVCQHTIDVTRISRQGTPSLDYKIKYWSYEQSSPPPSHSYALICHCNQTFDHFPQLITYSILQYQLVQIRLHCAQSGQWLENVLETMVGWQRTV